MPIQTYNVQEAKAHLSRLLKEVSGGAKVIIAKAGKPIRHLCCSDFSEWLF
jgi:antitoxin (DNA-binding transcriptional repressor) of toxin-antitoxin stability system